MVERVFVVGCPRSGTTLLQSMLAAHPDVLSFPETHALRVGIGRQGVQLFSWIQRKRLLKNLANELNTSLPSLPLFLWRKRFVAEMLSLLDRAAIEKDKKIWLEKTPEHLFYIPTIKSVAPDAKFIHITRNCHDVVPSIVKMWNAFTSDWSKSRFLVMDLNDVLCVFREVLKRPKLLSLLGIYSLFMYRRYVRASRLWHDSISISKNYEYDRNYFQCDYSELVKEPEQTLEKISKFLDIKYSASMLEFQNVSSSLIRSDEIWKSSNVNAIEKNRITEYDKLPQYVKRIVLGLCEK